MPRQSPGWLRHLSFANTCSLLALTVALGTGTAYAANTVRSVDIVNGQVRGPDIGANAVTTAKIRNSNVAGPDLRTGAVDSRVLRDDSLSSSDLGPGSVGSSEIAIDAVGASEVVAGAIDGDEVVDGSMTADDLGSDSVGASELAGNAVDSANVVNNSLSFSDIAGGAANGNVSIPSGAVPTGRCEGFNIAVGGAQPGDAVVFSVQEAMQDGVFWYGTNVPSAGTVRAQLCNLSGGTQSAITDLQVRIVTFR